MIDPAFSVEFCCPNQGKKDPYPPFIASSVHALCKELRNFYPEIFQKLYDNFGFPTDDGVKFEDRMKMAVYIELLKAGIIKS